MSSHRPRSDFRPSNFYLKKNNICVVHILLLYIIWSLFLITIIHVSSQRPLQRRERELKLIKYDYERKMTIISPNFWVQRRNLMKALCPILSPSFPHTNTDFILKKKKTLYKTMILPSKNNEFVKYIKYTHIPLLIVAIIFTTCRQ